VENSIFRDNRISESTKSRNSGLIFSELGGSIIIDNSIFSNNKVVGTTNEYIWVGLNAIICVLDVQGDPELDAMIYVTDSCFVGNQGVSSSLVLGGVWSDGRLHQTNNFAADNSFVEEDYACSGIGRIMMDPQYTYYGYYNFSKSDCVGEFSAATCILSVDDASGIVVNSIPQNAGEGSSGTLSSGLWVLLAFCFMAMFFVGVFFGFRYGTTKKDASLSVLLGDVG